MSREFPATVVPLPPRRAAKADRPAAADFPGTTLDAYHLLAKQGELSLGQIAAELRLAQDQVHAIVAELESLKLIRETDNGGVIAMPHSQAIDDLLAEQALLLAHAVDSVSEGQRRLRTVVTNRALLDPAEASRISSTKIGGSAQRGMFELPAEAAEAVSAMHPGGTFGEDLLERSLARAEEHLSRNVRMRVVHQSTVLRHPPMVAYLGELAALGCRVRLRDNLPFRMLLIDGTSAVCAVPTSGSYLLSGERVMVLLNRVFETTWVDAQPLERVLSRARSGGGTRAAAPEGSEGHAALLSPAHEAILRLLAEGQTDRSIARSLGVTTRTVTRRIGEIYEFLGVDSRFQAGIAAKELGIV
jgi:DNA-binding CsgD family transcriptional regulator